MDYLERGFSTLTPFFVPEDVGFLETKPLQDRASTAHGWCFILTDVTTPHKGDGSKVDFHVDLALERFIDYAAPHSPGGEGGLV